MDLLSGFVVFLLLGNIQKDFFVDISTDDAILSFYLLFTSTPCANKMALPVTSLFTIHEIYRL